MKARSLLFVLILGCVAVAVGWIYETRLREDSSVLPLEIPDNIDYYLTGLHYRSMDTDGRPDFEFTSRRLEHRRKTDVSHIEAPSLRIFRSPADWRIDSQQAAYEHRNNLLHLERDVVMQRDGDRPLQLFADRLSFAPDEDRVNTDSGIVMIDAAGRVEADSAVFDLAGEVFSLERARAVYN